MTAIEQIMKDAIQNGWNGITAPAPDMFQWSEKSLEVGYKKICEMSPFIDPLFWQALGRARRWGQQEVNHDLLKMRDGVCCECLLPAAYKCYHCKFSFCDEHGQTHFGPSSAQVPNCQGDKGEMTSSWLFVWHRFIDHLAEGEDAESFFSSLN